MFKRILRFLIRMSIILFITGIVILVVSRLITSIFASSRISDVQEVDENHIAIVFGAKLKWDGSPSAVLRDRVLAATDLYLAGKVNKLLMSGGSLEPSAMRTLAVEQGVLEEDIMLDEGGLRTYDTCYRAKNVFELDEAILVTTPFHLPRAVYLCHFLGIDVQGVEARDGTYWRGSTFFWTVRESMATAVALWEVHITKPEPEIAD